MKTPTTTAWAAALAVMSIQGPFTVAEAAPAQAQGADAGPKYYFPRQHIRSPQVNGTNSPSSDKSTADSSTSTSSGLLGIVPLLSFIPTSATSTSSDTDFLTTSASTTSSVSGSLPTSVIQPTSATSSANSQLLGSGNLLSSLFAGPASSTTSSSSSVATYVGLSSTFVGSFTYNSDVSSSSSSAGLLGTVTGLLSGSESVTPTAAATSIASTSDESSYASGTGSAPTTTTAPTSTESDSKFSFAPASSSSSGLLGSVTGPLTSILPLSPSATPSLSSSDSSASGNDSSIYSSQKFSFNPSATDLSSVASTIGLTSSDSLTSLPVSGSILGSSSFVPSFTLSTSGTTAVPIPIAATTSSAPSTSTASLTTGSNSTVSSVSSSSDTSVSASASSGAASLSTESTSASATATVSQSSTSSTAPIPTITSSTTPASNATFTFASPSQSVTLSDTSSTSLISTTSLSSSALTTETSSSSSTTTTRPPVSIVATGTDSATSLSVPTVVTFAQPSTTSAAEFTFSVTGSSTSGVGVDSTTTTATTGIPTALPRLIQPTGGMPTPPENMTLIQVGFNYSLNYPFVVRTPDSASQIFKYLPEGVAYALAISADQVVMNSLMPYDTTATLGYITTLAQAYIPGSLINQLELDIHTPASLAYSNPSAPVYTLMLMINPTISILPGATLNADKPTSVYNPAATTTVSAGDGAPIGGDSAMSKPVQGTSVGIGVGAVAGAAVYAAAMVYVARRYRKKRSSHQRASSVGNTGEMRQRSYGAMSGGYFMSGARYSSPTNGRMSRNSHGSSQNARSVREQGISAPVMSENSLGWN